jgi:hypothetical protein
MKYGLNIVQILVINTSFHTNNCLSSGEHFRANPLIYVLSPPAFDLADINNKT